MMWTWYFFISKKHTLDLLTY